MLLRTKQINAILIMVLLLTGLFTSSVYAQGCPGTEIYFNTATGNDQTGDGKSDATAFATENRALQAASACTHAVIIYRNGVRYRVLSPPIPEETGSPMAESLFIGVLLMAAVVFMAGAVVLRRRSNKMVS